MRSVDARLNKLELGAGLDKCGPEIHRLSFVGGAAAECKSDHWEAQHSGHILKSNDGESLEGFRGRVLGVMTINPLCGILILDRFSK